MESDSETCEEQGEAINIKTHESILDEDDGIDFGTGENLLNQLTNAVRTTTIDNDGCQFTIIERDGEIEVQSSCKGHGGGWVDVFGDSSKQDIFEEAEVEETEKHYARSRFYVVQYTPKSIDTAPTDASTSTAGVSSSHSKGTFSDSGVESDDAEQSPFQPRVGTRMAEGSSQTSDQPFAETGLRRFGLMRNLMQSQKEQADPSGD